jgi:heme exporter protein B
MAARPGEWLLPAAFFLLVAALFPFGVGADRELLGRIASGVLWVAALLAALLPVTALYGGDSADGTLDQYAVRGIAGETLALARLAALWLGLALPLLVALPVAALMLGLPAAQLPALGGGLALGLGGLAALANIAGALTLGARGGGGLAGIIVLPLAIPVLIFGAGAGQGGAALWLAAAVLILVAIAPFAVGQALAAARS